MRFRLGAVALALPRLAAMRATIEGNMGSITVGLSMVPSDTVPPCSAGAHGKTCTRSRQGDAPCHPKPYSSTTNLASDRRDRRRPSRRRDQTQELTHPGSEARHDRLRWLRVGKNRGGIYLSAVVRFPSHLSSPPLSCGGHRHDFAVCRSIEQFPPAARRILGASHEVGHVELDTPQDTGSESDLLRSAVAALSDVGRIWVLIAATTSDRKGRP